MSWNKYHIIPLILASLIIQDLNGQCLSSANPVGGAENLLVLEKGSLRMISFYKYAQGTRYYETDHLSDFDMISKAYYNYLSLLAGYGLSNRITLESEAGFFFNKSQIYNVDPPSTLTGRGFSNISLTGKFNLYRNNVKRSYYSAGIGIKMPTSRKSRTANNVELPVELQPTLGSFGFIVNSSWVKEFSETGIRIFITNRMEAHFPNPDEYTLGTAFFNAVFVSKHIMLPRIRGDWTTILQVRNEIRTPDKISGDIKESSGGYLFFVTPQINHMVKEKWNLSVMADLPVYQHFRGTQLGAGLGITCIISRTFKIRP